MLLLLTGIYIVIIGAALRQYTYGSCHRWGNGAFTSREYMRSYSRDSCSVHEASPLLVMTFSLFPETEIKFPATSFSLQLPNIRSNQKNWETWLWNPKKLKMPLKIPSAENVVRKIEFFT